MNIAIVLAGGTGSRLGADIPKQYIEVRGRKIISYVLSTLSEADDIDGIRIVCEDMWQELIDRDDMCCMGRKFMGYSRPGVNRQLSILSALCDIRKDINNHIYAASSEAGNINVMIHDAARPLLTAELIHACFEMLEGHDGVMPVLPMKDTVYISEDGSSITGTLKREQLYAGQAPEVFAFEKYYRACEKLLPDKILEINGSSEPAIMAGLDIVMIPGDENNYKITTYEDLERFKQ